MAIPRPSLQEITDRCISKIRQSRPDLIADVEGSAVGLIAGIVAEEFDNFWGILEELVRESSITTATGASLDQIGTFLGSPRKVESKATSLGLSKSVKFTNLGGSTVNVPANTRVWSTTNPNVAFFTTEGLVLTAGNSDLVHVSSAGTGQFYNVDIGQLTSHNAPTSAVVVTNIIPIQNGSEQESDDSYRERLLQEMRRRNVTNTETVVAMLRGVDGVKDVLPLPKYRGNGTFDAIIIPYHRSQANSVVAKCQEMLDRNLSVTSSGRARLPIERLLVIKLSLVFKTSATNKDSVRQNVRAQIIARLDGLGVSSGSDTESLFLDQLKAVAVNSDNSVVDATMTVSLDGRTISPSGELRVGLGERIVLDDIQVR
jgi:uncharacterized phage protein gp47/JayE